MFRLVIDLPLGDDIETATESARKVISEIKDKVAGPNNIYSLQYLMQKDEDRRRHNYLDLDENGHASGKKLKL